MSKKQMQESYGVAGCQNHVHRVHDKRNWNPFIACIRTTLFSFFHFFNFIVNVN